METFYEIYNDRGCLINIRLASGNKVLEPIKKKLLLMVEDALINNQDTSALDNKLKSYL